MFASGTQAAGRFNESASYDSNGNITSLTRNATSGVIDSLAYQYRGNMMIRITDNAPAVLRDSGFVYRAPANPEDIAYTYNRNGAMISDYHRRVEIEYNLLNLPQRVTNTMDTTKSIAYSYDSRGGKLRRQAMDGGVVTSTVDYAGNKLYTDGTLSKVLIPGGYINVSGSQASYMFFATDHLGSVRQVLDSNGAQQEQNDYYPFGMQQRRGGYLQTTANKYKYNGKEQDKFGDFTTLDYGARFYDPAIARWNTVDPLAEKYPWATPYSCCLNNPVRFIDPNGKEAILVIWTTGTAGNGVGHAGIAVSNYKKEKYTEYDANGVARENYRMVADGTYTFYDNWPGGDGVNFDLKGALTSVDAHRNVSQISSFDEFTNGFTVSPSETNAPNALLKLSTSYEQDMAISGRLLNANQEKKEYNGAWYNCSSYVSDGLKAIFGKTVGKESMLGPIKSVTPNQLWKDTQTNAEKNNIPYLILKDPGSEADNKFRATMKGGN